MVGNASRIAGVVDLPVIADADTGYGNELNVVRTVREFERHGIAAIHIEDQVFPKKVRASGQQGDHSRSTTTSPRSARPWTRGAVPISSSSRAPMRGRSPASRRRPRAPMPRSRPGADIAFVEAPQTMDEIKAVPRLVAGPCLLNVVRRGKTPPIELDAAKAMGYKLAILPSLFRGVIGCCEELLAELKTGVFPIPPKDLSPREAFARFDADEWDALRERYREGPKSVADRKVAKAG